MYDTPHFTHSSDGEGISFIVLVIMNNAAVTILVQVFPFLLDTYVGVSDKNGNFMLAF